MQSETQAGNEARTETDAPPKQESTDESADGGALGPACGMTRGAQNYHTSTPTDALFAFYRPCPECFEGEDDDERQRRAQELDQVIKATGSNATLAHKPVVTDGGQLVEQESAEKTYTEITAFKRDILWVLSLEGNSKGLTVMDALETYYDEEINHGRLYPNLDDLAEAGLVEKGQRDLRTNDYSLTEAGRRELTKRQTWQHGGSDE